MNTRTNLWRTIGLTLGFLFMYMLTIVMAPPILQALASLGMEVTKTRILQFSLFSEIIQIIFILLFCRAFFKLNADDLWLGHPQKATFYMMGYGAGIVLFTVFIILSLPIKNLVYAGKGSMPALDILLYLPAFGIQSFQEELLTRGLLQRVIKDKWGVTPSIIIPSLFFAVLHLANDGIHVVAVLNLFLVGILFALMVYATGSLWYAAAAHGAWNYVQGVIFGQQISGIDLGGSLLRFDVISNNTLINGGAFGPEGSIIVTLILSLGIAYYYNKMKHKDREIIL